MATTFYLRDTAQTGMTLPSGWTPTCKLLSLTAGSSNVTLTVNTVASLSTTGASGTTVQNVIAAGTTYTVPISTAKPNSAVVWISNPLNGITLTQQISAQPIGLESNAMANYGFGAELYQLSSAGVTTLIGSGINGSEFATIGTVRGVTITPSVTLSTGDRFLLAVFYCAVGGTSASSFTASLAYNGSVGGSGFDSSLNCNDTITEASGGSTYTKSGYAKEHG